MKFSILLVLVGLVAMLPTVAQPFNHDLAYILAHQPSVPLVATGVALSDAASPTNELSFLATGLIRTYQRYISSQDMSVCVFSPSCSRFGAIAIKRYGLFEGALMISDRLQRCNPYGVRYYQFDEKTGHYDDPVDRYRLW